MVGDLNDAGAEPIFSAPLDPGWHLIGLPALPEPEDPYTIFDYIPIEYRLYGWAPTIGCYVTVDPFDPDLLPAVVSGEGYWLNIGTTDSISYLGLPWEVGAVRPIPLGPAGWHLIGNPHEERVPLDYCMIDHAGTERTMADAVNQRWILLPMYAWDRDMLSYSTVGLLGPPDEADNALTAWAGYWLNTLVDNLRLVVQRPLGDGPFQAWLVSNIGGMQQEYTLDLSVESGVTVVAAAPIYATKVQAVISGPSELVDGNVLSLFRADNWSLKMPFGKHLLPRYDAVPPDETYDYIVQVEATTASGTDYSVPLSLHVIGIETPP